MQDKIAIIGLGYVGLPLARLFATRYPVVGFDIDPERVGELQQGIDSTQEITQEQLNAVLQDSPKMETGLYCTDKLEDMSDCNIFIVTVPTPVDETKRPVLTPLYKASKAVGSILKEGDIVIYESTVYPGLTEEECVPILAEESGLKFNEQFFAGYSPERINPGDKNHTVEKILKVTAGSTPEIAEKINALYASVIEAGTYLAPSIKVAEAAKVIENSQRDINIAFVNELAKIFNLMDLDTHEVLNAAATKWNFLRFTPGLVGGHCIGVDPYYLAQKAQQFGYHPEIILAGRRVNDGMGAYVAAEIVKLMILNDIRVRDSKVLMLGITFKENCPDVRNSKAVDLAEHLLEYGCELTIWDPWVEPEEVYEEYGIKTVRERPGNGYDMVVLAVAHREFLEPDVVDVIRGNGLVYDIKSVLDPDLVNGRL